MPTDINFTKGMCCGEVARAQLHQQRMLASAGGHREAQSQRGTAALVRGLKKNSDASCGSYQYAVRNFNMSLPLDSNQSPSVLAGGRENEERRMCDGGYSTYGQDTSRWVHVLRISVKTSSREKQRDRTHYRAENVRNPDVIGGLASRNCST